MGAPALWGTTYLVTSELLPAGRPLMAATVRALPIGVLFIAMLGRWPASGQRLRTLVVSACNISVFFPLLFVAAYRLPGGLAATIVATQPLVVGVLSAMLLAEPLRARQVVASLSGLAGVAMLVGGASATPDPVGVVAAAGAALSMALGLVLTQRWRGILSLRCMPAWQLFFGGILLIPPLLVLDADPLALDVPGAFGLLHLAVLGGGVAYWLWFRALRTLSPNVLSVLMLLSPVTATVLGAVLAAQFLTVAQLFGVTLVLASVGWMTWTQAPTTRTRV
nr:DMT family transporter [Egibacter rhizosphaerae]